MDIGIPEYKTLVIFREVASRGSVSLAAKYLGLTQSAISHQISKLENMLDVKLIDRETRPIGLTKEGIIFYRKCLGLIEKTQNIIYGMRPDPNALMPTLRIGLKNANYPGDILFAIKKHVQFPSVVLMPTENLINQFAENKLDLIFCSKVPELDIPYHRKLICRSKVVILYHDELAKQMDSVTLKNLAHHAPFINFAMSTELGHQIQHYFQDKSIITENFMAVSTFSMCINLLLRKPAWSFIIPAMLESDIQRLLQSPISYIHSPEPSMSIEWHLIAQPNVPINIFNQIANYFIAGTTTLVNTHCVKFFPDINSLVEISKPLTGEDCEH